MPILKKLEISEALLELKFIRGCKTENAIVIKLTPAGRRGWPDRLVLKDGGKAGFVELKRRGQKPRKLQAHIHGILRKLGFRVIATDSLEAALRFVAAL